MGQQIVAPHFRRRDFQQFERRLRAETDLVGAWLEEDRFVRQPPVAGLELEAWLVHPNGTPAPVNETFLAAVARPTVVPELARFNIELNVSPQPLAGRGLDALEAELRETWSRCIAVAEAMDVTPVAIGILPTLRDGDLVPANMSRMARYRALNEQVLRQRHGRPTRLAIDGRDRLESEHHDVMLEAGTTSLQAHLQVTPEDATRCYNAAVLASAPMVALAANSPFLFGRDLWDETRVPLFEQAVGIGSFDAGYRGAVPRVNFGTGYAGWSLAQHFRENLDLFPPMLPLALDDDPARLAHLRLHNGTIWRWNRPLVGFEGAGAPHLRIEHRVMAAGTTIADMMANLAGFYGFAAALAADPAPPEARLPFDVARSNFYAAARHGLDAPITWLDGTTTRLADFVLATVLPAAATGLERLGVARDIADRHLAVLGARAASGRTGAHWQRRTAAALDGDVRRLTLEYLARQRTDRPVHEWEI